MARRVLVRAEANKYNHSFYWWVQSNPFDTALISTWPTGVAIYTIFVLFGNTGDLTQVRFTLDGNQMGGFLHNDSLPGLPAGTTPTYLYNQTIFSKTGLSNSEHVLSLIADGNSDKPSVMLFDYAIYT